MPTISKKRRGRRRSSLDTLCPRLIKRDASAEYYCKFVSQRRNYNVLVCRRGKCAKLYFQWLSLARRTVRLVLRTLPVKKRRCVNSLSAARGSREAGFTQPGLIEQPSTIHNFAHDFRTHCDLYLRQQLLQLRGSTFFSDRMR